MENSSEDIYYMRTGFGPRFGAVVIDGVILAVIGYALKFALGLKDPAPEDFMGLSMGEIMLLSIKNNMISTIIGMAYMSMELFLRKTPGKMALGLIITDVSSNTPAMSALLIRNLYKQAGSIMLLLAILLESAFFLWISFGMSFMYIVGSFFALGDSKLALHDIIAKTAVYKEKELAELQNS